MFDYDNYIFFNVSNFSKSCDMVVADFSHVNPNVVINKVSKLEK